MRAEIISIGTELLLGEIVDTNAAWLAQRLAEIGVDVFFRTTVGDNVTRIADVIRAAMQRAEVVITSGGLGPTVDDVTREGIAAATGRELVLDETLLEQVRARFARLRSPMMDNNVKQAYIPRGAQGIENPVGTAPIFLLEYEGKFIFTLPGVPSEMKYLTTNSILPWLRAHLGDERIILSKTLRTCAIGESMVDSKIADLETSTNPTVGLAAHPGQTDVRITAKAATRAQAEALIREMEARVRERLGDVIYGEGTESIEEVVARLLTARNWRLALLETNTRGRIAERLRQTPEGARVLADAAQSDAPARVDERAALEHARALLQTSRAEVALVVLGAMSDTPNLYDESGHTALAVVTRDSENARSYSVSGGGEVAQNWIRARALDLVRRALIKQAPAL